MGPEINCFTSIIIFTLTKPHIAGTHKKASKTFAFACHETFPSASCLYLDIAMENIQVAVIMPQPACNMFCSFCVTENNFDTMTYEQGNALLEYLRGINVSNVVVGGGEPFYWEHLTAFCRHAKYLGFLVQAGTNATLLPVGFEYSDIIDRFVIPLEAANEDIHNSMRFAPPSHYKTIMDCLAKLKTAKKSVTISTVITRANINAVPDLAEFLRTYNEGSGHLHAWHLYKFIPKGRGGASNAESLSVSLDEYEAIFARVKSARLPFKVFKRGDMYKSKTVAFFSYQNGKICSSEDIKQNEGNPC